MHGSSVDQPYFPPNKSQTRKNPSMGLLQAPPLLPHSVVLQQPPPHAQPPLLPLPAAHHHRSSSSRGGLSSPPAVRNSHRNVKDHPPPPPHSSKKSKSSTKIPRKEEKKKSPVRSSSRAVNTTVPSTIPLGTDTSKEMMPKSNVDNVIPGFSGFTISSPPPSSLPLPTFSLRRKSIKP